MGKPTVFKRDAVWKQTGGEFRSQEDALLDREHDDPAAIAKEAAKEGISVESYLHMRENQEQLGRLKRIVKSANHEVADQAKSDPEKARRLDALRQAQINGLLGLSPELDRALPEPRNRGGAPKGNQNARKRSKKTTSR